MNLSAHFTLDELTRSETAFQMGIDNTPTREALNNLHDLAAALEEVRKLLDRPIIISSGYRCPELNAAVGGSGLSAHIAGLAADFVSPPAHPMSVCRQIEGSLLMFDQLIYEHTWVHFGIGPRNRRQVLTLKPGPGSGYETGLISAGEK